MIKVIQKVYNNRVARDLIAYIIEKDGQQKRVDLKELTTYIHKFDNATGVYIKNKFYIRRKPNHAEIPEIYLDDLNVYEYKKAEKEVRLLYLKDDMKIMGYLFENIQQHIKNVDVEAFVEKFMSSTIRAAMDECDPQLLNMASVNVLERYIELELDNKLLEIRKPDKRQVFKPNELYWIGSTYAYISTHKDISSKDLIIKLTFKELCNLYEIGHEMGYSNFLDRITL